ncbi:MAG: hypothetical protein BVN35_02310 [Proteobacteria bacterium ST_bin11]|nr:MAG: hypothetical protein BVN35_02310 [Proteobacteria bacterium ST_bin11]
MGLTPSQWRASALLPENENCRQIDLADILKIKPITLVNQFDLLKASGMAVRNNELGDRRACRLSIAT